MNAQVNKVEVINGLSNTELREYIGEKGLSRKNREDLLLMAVERFNNRQATVDLQQADAMAAEAEESNFAIMRGEVEGITTHDREGETIPVFGALVGDEAVAALADAEGDVDDAEAGMAPSNPTPVGDDEDEETQSDVQNPFPWADMTNAYHVEIIEAIQAGTISAEEGAQLASLSEDETPPPTTIVPSLVNQVSTDGGMNIAFVPNRHNRPTPAQGTALPPHVGGPKKAKKAGKTNAKEGNGRPRNRSLSDNDVRGIIQRKKEGASFTKLAKHFDKSTTFINNVVQGNIYTDVDLTIAYDPTIPVGQDNPIDVPQLPSQEEYDARVAVVDAAEHEAERRAEMGAEDRITGFDQ